MAGIIAGENVLLDRLAFGANAKVIPVADQQLRDHIQLTHNLDDEIILGVGGYVFAATAEVENRACVSLIRQRRRHYFDTECFKRLSGRTLQLGYGPVISLTSVSYLDSDEATQVLGSTDYYRHSNGQVYLKGELPTFAKGPNTMWIDYESGFGDTSAAVPAEWQALVMQIAMRRYERREGAAGSGDDAWERCIDRQIVIAGGNRRYA